MSALVIEKGFLTLNSERYSEMNWFEMKAFSLNLSFEKQMFELKENEKRNGIALMLKEILAEELKEKKTTPKSGKPKFN